MNDLFRATCKQCGGSIEAYWREPAKLCTTCWIGSFMNVTQLIAELHEAFPGCPKGRDLMETYVSPAAYDRIRDGMPRGYVPMFLGRPIKADVNLPDGGVGFAFTYRKDCTVPNHVLVEMQQKTIDEKQKEISRLESALRTATQENARLYAALGSVRTIVTKEVGP